MKDQFVPYELAVKLKELGFDEECFGCSYRDTPDQKSSLNIYFAKQPINNSSLKEDKGIALPLWQQAFDWFREKHNLDSYVRKITYREWKLEINYILQNDSKEEWEKYKKFQDYKEAYEEARKACLEELIKILEERNHETHNQYLRSSNSNSILLGNIIFLYGL